MTILQNIIGKRFWLLMAFFCPLAALAQPSSILSRLTILDPALSFQPLCVDQVHWPDGDGGCLACDSGGCGDANIMGASDRLDAFGNQYTRCFGAACRPAVPPKLPCGNGEVPTDMVVGRLNSKSALGFETLFVIDGACENVQHPFDGFVQNVAVSPGTQSYLAVDPVNGRMELRVREEILFTAQGGNWMWFDEALMVSGLPTLFDVLVTYTPTGEVDLGAAAMPEGILTPLDAQDLVTGTVAMLRNLTPGSRTCNVVPAPQAGSGATIADPLPTPGPKEAFYFLVASRAGTDTRTGRQQVAGRLLGRPTANLAACQ